MSSPQPLRLLSDLVAIPSVSGNEGEAVQYVRHVAGAAGIDCELVGGGALLRVARGAGPRLLFTSHLDTVPVGGGWHGDPYDGTWRDGRLIARGANDAKASVVAMLCAAIEVALSSGQGGFQGELFLALNACEETSNAGMAAVLERIDPPEAAVVGEPTGLQVVRSQAGLAVLIARWTGRSCHAAHVARVQHVNALVVACEELAAFGSRATIPSPHELFDGTTLVPTQLESGERHNVVPDRAQAVFDARIAPPHDVTTCVEHLQSALPRAEILVRSSRLEAVDTAADHPLVRCSLSLTGRKRAIGSPTLSDMALLGHVPAIKCGPGMSERSHTPNEYVTEAELLAGCAFYEGLASRLGSALLEARPV